MKDADAEREQQLQWLRREVDRGWAEAQSGRLTPSATVKTELTGFKKRWKARQRPAAK